jgi:acylaminoacyl-peptidase
MMLQVMSRVLLPALLCVACANAQARRFAPEDIFRLQWVSEPQISPDGTRIAYVRNRMSITDDQRHTSLWLIGTDGERDRMLVAEDVLADTVRWSPDGERLLYVLPPGRVQVMQLSSGETREAAVFPSRVSAAAWSPDGRSIALVTRVLREPAPLFQMPVKPEGATWAPLAKVITEFPYRRDGVGGVPSGTDQVFIVDALGGEQRQLTRGAEDMGEPAWTSDSQSLLVTADRRADRSRKEADREIYRLSLSQPDKLVALTAHVGPDRAPTVSPRGDLIAWLGVDDNGEAYTPAGLYVANTDGGSKRLTASLDREVTAAKWDHAGTGLFFLYGEAGVTKLGYVSLRGAVRALAAGVGPGMIGHPSMPPGSLSVARNGAVAFTSSAADRPGDLALYYGNRVRQLTDLNRELFADRELAAVEAIRFPSKVDGLPIDAWIMKPPAFDPRRRYPLALSIHGGPWSAYGPYFSADHQLFAAAGYVVVYVNPRGSTSYGRDFANWTSHNFPSHDVDDLLSSVDAVIARGYIDESNLFVMGASGGGTLSA